MITIDSLIRDLNLVREKAPLVHNITNYVAMNNSANALLAIGASPVMAHSLDEAAEMATIAASVVINIGTLDAEWVKAMLIAGKTALDKGTPMIFDPVGAGATSYRSEVCNQIITHCKPSIIRGNASEIMALHNANMQTKGVDSTNSSDAALASAQALAHTWKTVVVISGETDYITNGEVVEVVKNGNTMMAKVTGMGCTASAVVGAFAAVNRNYLEAATHAMCIMGISGEVAARNSKGNGSLQMNFLDTLFHIDDTLIKENILL